MRIALAFMPLVLSCVSVVAQELGSSGDQKPTFTDLQQANTPQIVVEVRFLTGPNEVFKELKADDLIRTATRKAQRVLPAVSDKVLQQQGGIQLVSATTTLKTHEPVFVRTLSDDQVRRVVQTVQGNVRSNILFAPKVAMFDKQEAEIKDTVIRPFVVGLTKTGNAHQPEIAQISDGIQIGMRATVKGQDVRMDLAIDVSDIQGVVTKSAGPEGTAVQVPSVRTTELELSAMVTEGQTLAICGFSTPQEVRQTQAVPVLGKVPYVSRMFKNSAVGTEYQEMMILITPRVLSQAEIDR